MCMFSAPVDSVSQTKIFARRSNRRQWLVYSTNLGSSQDVAMILPIPVERGAGENAVTFIDMSDYTNFFDDLEKGFPRAKSLVDEVGADLSFSFSMLAVHDVGAFEASFVPTLADFERLDPRFRLPDRVWERLPQYRDFGFAVFKLRAGSAEIHPMAFSYPTSVEDLFFPTVHVHDGEVHELEQFDHTLYGQDETRDDLSGTEKSALPAVSFMRPHPALAGDRRVHRVSLVGVFDNADVRI